MKHRLLSRINQRARWRYASPTGDAIEIAKARIFTAAVAHHVSGLRTHPSL